MSAVSPSNAVTSAETPQSLNAADDDPAPEPAVPPIGTPPHCANCANCGQPVAALYCAQCGQSREDHSRSIGAFVRELVEHHLLLDGKSMRTLLALAVRPGLLTRCYIEGRRARYVSPVRLYLFASLAFFLTLWASGVAILQFTVNHVPRAPFERSVGPSFHVGGEGEGRGITILGAPDPDDPGFLWLPGAEILHPALQGSEPPASWKVVAQAAGGGLPGRILHGFFVAMAHPKALNGILDTWLPRLLVLLLPVAALGFALFNLRRPFYFVDHLAFAVHCQAFAFLLVSLAVLVRVALPELPYVAVAVAVATLGYAVAAYHYAYRRGWIGSVITLAIVGSVYGLMLALGLLGVLIYGFATLDI